MIRYCSAVVLYSSHLKKPLEAVCVRVRFCSVLNSQNYKERSNLVFHREKDLMFLGEFPIIRPLLLLSRVHSSVCVFLNTCVYFCLSDVVNCLLFI